MTYLFEAGVTQLTPSDGQVTPLFCRLANFLFSVPI